MAMMGLESGESGTPYDSQVLTVTNGHANSNGHAVKITLPGELVLKNESLA